MSGVSAFSAYFNEDNYTRVNSNKTSTTAYDVSGGYEKLGGSIFGDVDYSSAYDSIFDEFHKTVDEAEQEAIANGEKAPDRDQETRDGFNASKVAKELEDAANYDKDGWKLNTKVFDKYIFGYDDSYEALNGAELAKVNEEYMANTGKTLEDMIWDEYHSGYYADYQVAKLRNSLEVFQEHDEDGNVVSNRYISDIENDEELSDEFMDHMVGKFNLATIEDDGTNFTTLWEVMSLKPEALKQVIDYYNDNVGEGEKTFEQILKSEVNKDGVQSEQKQNIKDVYKEATGKKLW